jgi:hypothetical protein
LWDGHLARPGKVTGYFDSTFENIHDKIKELFND